MVRRAYILHPSEMKKWVKQSLVTFTPKLTLLQYKDTLHAEFRWATCPVSKNKNIGRTREKSIERKST